MFSFAGVRVLYPSTLRAFESARTVAVKARRKKNNSVIPDWQDPKRYRNFFDSISKELNFSSLDDWYSVTKKTFESKKIKGLSTVLATYKYNFPKALHSIYPEHKWQLWRSLSTKFR